MGLALLTALQAAPAIIGALGALFGKSKKKTEYTSGLSKQDQAFRNWLQGQIQNLANTYKRYIPQIPRSYLDAQALLYKKYGLGPVPTYTFKSYAQGGIADRPQIALLAERGPEAIVPLGTYGRQQQRWDINISPEYGLQERRVPWESNLRERLSDATILGQQSRTKILPEQGGGLGLRTFRPLPINMSGGPQLRPTPFTPMPTMAPASPRFGVPLSAMPNHPWLSVGAQPLMPRGFNPWARPFNRP